jgi:uncharacterized membrane protein
MNKKFDWQDWIFFIMATFFVAWGISGIVDKGMNFNHILVIICAIILFIFLGKKSPKIEMPSKNFPDKLELLEE